MGHVEATVLAYPERRGQSVLEEGSHVSAETSRCLELVVSLVGQDGAGQILPGRTRSVKEAIAGQGRAGYRRSDGLHYGPHNAQGGT